MFFNNPYFSIFLFVTFVFILISYFIFLYNRKYTIQKKIFLAKSKKLKPIKLEKILVWYLVHRGGRINIHSPKYFDFYVFENSIVFFYKQNFFLKILYPPALVLRNKNDYENSFGIKLVYTIEKITFSNFGKTDVKIILKEKKFPSYKFDMTLKGLNEHQKKILIQFRENVKM